MSAIMAGDASLVSSITLPLGADRDGMGDFFTKFEGCLVSLKLDICGCSCASCSFLDIADKSFSFALFEMLLAVTRKSNEN